MICEPCKGDLVALKAVGDGAGVVDLGGLDNTGVVDLGTLDGAGVENLDTGVGGGVDGGGGHFVWLGVGCFGSKDTCRGFVRCVACFWLVRVCRACLL